MGAPAAGKGTQCEKIVEKVLCLPTLPLLLCSTCCTSGASQCCSPCAMQYKLVHISVGDLLRAEVAAGTPAGRRAQSFMDSGNLVPNEVLLPPPAHGCSGRKQLLPLTRVEAACVGWFGVESPACVLRLWSTW